MIKQIETPKIKKVLLVNSWSAGAFYVDSLNRRGYQCFHLDVATYDKWESNTALSYKNFINENDYKFQKSYKYVDFKNINELFELIKHLNIDLVIPCTDLSVEISEKIQNKLGLLGNDYLKQKIRRNKFYMQKALKDNKLSYIGHAKIKNFNELKYFYQKHNNSKIILKELTGAGSHNLQIVNNPAELLTKFQSITESYSVLKSGKNTEILAEEFIDGKEFVINCVSRNGKHKIDAVYEYKKNIVDNNHTIFDEIRLVTKFDTHYKKAFSYMFKVLDSIGVKNGPSHSELFFKKDKSVVLIETNIRISGDGGWTQGYHKVTGEYEYDIILDALLSDAGFNQYTSFIDKKLNGTFSVKFLFADKQYPFNAKRVEANIRKIPGVKQVFLTDWYCKDGKTQKTIDFLSKVGRVIIWGKDEKALDNACKIINNFQINEPKNFFSGNIELK